MFIFIYYLYCIEYFFTLIESVERNIFFDTIAIFSNFIEF